jgi:cell division septation protein DedD
MSKQLQPSNPQAKLRKTVFVGFAGTVTLGLCLAGWYVGGRVFAAEQHVIRLSLTPPPSDPEPAPAQTVNAKPVWNPVNPRLGETYLQLAAMGPLATKDYLQELAAKGIHPLIAPGPTDGIFRILTGPYANTTALEQARQALEAAGAKPMVRTY